MKRVLMVAFHYPPEGGSSGVLRALKFSKYLPGFGWEPHVLTVHEDFYRTKDEALLDEVPPEAVVHRTRAFDTARHFAIGGRYLETMSIPDRFVGWWPFAVHRARSFMSRCGIDVLFSTSPPATSHLIAGSLKRRTGLPWIADFRDPWIEEGAHPLPGSWRERVERRMEQRVVAEADRIVLTTPRFRTALRERYPDQPEDKFEVVFNGFDEADFKNLPQPTKSERFEIVHAGLVTRAFRDPLPVLRAVAQLVAEGRMRPSEVRVTFLGASGWLYADGFRRQVDDLGLSGIVEVEPRVPHPEALRRLARAAVLLLLQASEDTSFLIPAKAFEYLRLSRPIVAVTLPGATAELLSRFEDCFTFEPNQVELIAATFERLYLQWKEERSGSLPRPRSGVDEFERRRLTGELASILANACYGRTGVS